MAIWHVTFALVPNQNFDASGQIGDADLDALLTGAKNAYTGFNPPDVYKEHVDLLLDRRFDEGSPVELWGNPTSDDVTIWRNGETIHWIEVRLDVRKLDDVLITGVLLIAKSWDCTLVEIDHRMICRFNEPEMRQMLAGHAASRAIKSPDIWLPHLADRAARPEA